MRLYLDSSALVKRYVEEEGSDEVRAAMAVADSCSACLVGFAETYRAVGRAAGDLAVRRFRAEWPFFEIVEFDWALIERAGKLGWRTGLRTLDALHLAAASRHPKRQIVFATWDRQLHRVAREQGFRTLPAVLE